MLAVSLLKNRKGIQSFEMPMAEIKTPDDVLVQVRQIGLDRTDFNTVRLGLQTLLRVIMR